MFQTMVAVKSSLKCSISSSRSASASQREACKNGLYSTNGSTKGLFQHRGADQYDKAVICHPVLWNSK